GTQYPQPLQMSCWTTTVSNSVWKRAPVGHTSTHAAWVQCLHTSEDMSQRNSPRSSGGAEAPGSSNEGIPRSTVSLRPRPVSWWPSGSRCSMKATCRQLLASSPPVLSKDMPVKFRPSSGTRFHSLQATSQALQPIHTLVSVKNPRRSVLPPPSLLTVMFPPHTPVCSVILALRRYSRTNSI